MKEKNNIKEKEKTMNEKMKNELNVMLSDDMLAEINGGVGGGIGFPNQEVDVEEVKAYMKSVAAAYSREIAIEIGMQLLGCSREEAEKMLDE
jgi:hypothetical protein